jgi:hypothetical protein
MFVIWLRWLGCQCFQWFQCFDLVLPLWISVTPPCEEEAGVANSDLSCCDRRSTRGGFIQLAISRAKMTTGYQRIPVDGMVPENLQSPSSCVRSISHHIHIAVPLYLTKSLSKCDVGIFLLSSIFDLERTMCGILVKRNWSTRKSQRSVGSNKVKRPMCNRQKTGIYGI